MKYYDYEDIDVPSKTIIEQLIFTREKFGGY
jgi:hypothetical protein